VGRRSATSAQGTAGCPVHHGGVHPLCGDDFLTHPEFARSQQQVTLVTEASPAWRHELSVAARTLLAMGAPGFRFIDLFAGIGGFHAAMKTFGGECVYAVEMDPRARLVYETNWGHPASGFNVNGDITLDDPAAIPDHEVLCAGFPCQPFSKSGAQRGMDEARGTLFYNIAKIIEAKRPLVVLLENVRNLIGPRHTHEWDVIITTLRQLGYHVSRTPAIFSPHLLPPRMGGTPQVRERVFITATRSGVLSKIDPKATGPEPVASMRDRFPLHDGEEVAFDPKSTTDGWHLRDVLDAVPPAGYGLTDFESHWIAAWDDFVSILRSEGEPLPGFPVWADSWGDFPEIATLKFPALEHTESPKPLDSVGDGFVVPATVTVPHIDRTLPDWKRSHLKNNYALFARRHERLLEWACKWGVFRSEVFPPSRRKLEWQAQDAPSLWDTVIQLRPSGIRAKKETYLPALVAITQTSIIGRLERRITPRETARLQGLPDTFEFPVQSDATTYKQLGNGVAVGAVAHVFRQHIARDRWVLEDASGTHLDDGEQRERAAELLAAVDAAPLDPRDVLAPTPLPATEPELALVPL
jgi:DNA (cytosine-5)-methyltransferase 1